MLALRCNLDKVIIATSFLVFLIISGLLLIQEGEEAEDYTQWLLDKVRGGWQQEAGHGNFTQLEQAGKRLLQSYLNNCVSITVTTVTTSPSQQS